MQIYRIIRFIQISLNSLIIVYYGSGSCTILLKFQILNLKCWGVFLSKYRPADSLAHLLCGRSLLSEGETHRAHPVNWIL